MFMNFPEIDQSSKRCKTNTHSTLDLSMYSYSVTVSGSQSNFVRMTLIPRITLLCRVRFKKSQVCSHKNIVVLNYRTITAFNTDGNSSAASHVIEEKIE